MTYKQRALDPRAFDKRGRLVRKKHLLLAVLGLVVATALLLESCKMLGIGGEAPFADIVFEPGDKPFDILLTDEIQGVQFGDRYGEAYVLNNPEEIVAFIELLEGITVKERYNISSELVQGIYSHYEYTFSVLTKDVNFSVQVSSPTLSMYRYT
ncbi:MAG: hypothetical protein LBU07_07630 [Coriobacteriales bacterium]|nr:hypothetical protein [Coriobacteriales bacterium]